MGQLDERGVGVSTFLGFPKYGVHKMSSFILRFKHERVGSRYGGSLSVVLTGPISSGVTCMKQIRSSWDVHLAGFVWMFMLWGVHRSRCRELKCLNGHNV